ANNTSVDTKDDAGVRRERPKERSFRVGGGELNTRDRSPAGSAMNYCRSHRRPPIQSGSNNRCSPRGGLVTTADRTGPGPRNWPSAQGAPLASFHGTPAGAEQETNAVR